MTSSALHDVDTWVARIGKSYDTYLEHLLTGNRNGCGDIVSQLLEEGVPIRTLYVELLQRALYKVGDLWEQNRISVAREHLATAITEFLLNLIYPKIFSSDHCDRSAVVACVANEHHQMGAKMVADIIELNGWNGYFLGANTPAEDLLSFLREKQPDLLALSLSLHANLPTLLQTVEVVRQEFPKLPVIVGGQAFRFGSHDALIGLPGVTLLSSIAQLEELIKRFS